MDNYGRQVRPGRSLDDHFKKRPAGAMVSAPLSSEQDEAAYQKILEEFDLDYTFGPSNGISRLTRWERADQLGLNPPEEVKTIIQRLASSDSKHNESLWNRFSSGIKEPAKVQ